MKAIIGKKVGAVRSDLRRERQGHPCVTVIEALAPSSRRRLSRRKATPVQFGFEDVPERKLTKPGDASHLNMAGGLPRSTWQRVRLRERRRAEHRRHIIMPTHVPRG